MKTFRMAGPSGPMETVATDIQKAWSNLRYRLIREYGMSWYAASRYDHSDLKEVKGGDPMTIAELNALESVPRIAKELELISTLLRTIATIEYANTIDCTDLCGHTQRAVVLEKVREDLGIKTSAE